MKEGLDFSQLASGIQRYLHTHCAPHRFRVTSLVDYGSRSRGEGGIFSDIDLAVLVVSPTALCGSLLGPGDRAPMQGKWGALPIVRNEYWKDAIISVVQANADWSLICPTSEIYDARVIAMSLARGSGPQALIIASGQSCWDPEGLHPHLKRVLRRGGLRPVLSTRLVEELVSRSERGRKQMHSDLGSLRSGPVEWPEEPPIPRLLYGAYLWVKPAVQCIREAVGAWTLVEKGWPEWRRKNVLQFISSHDPDFCPSAREAYFYKSTLRGRARFRRLIAGSRAEILGRIEVLTEEIDSFCQRAIAKVMDGEEGLREVPSGISCRFLRHPVLQPTS